MEQIKIIFFVLTSFFGVENGQAQSETTFEKNSQKAMQMTKNDFKGNWNLNFVDGNFFPKGNLQLKKTKIKKDDYYIFKADGTLAYHPGNYEVECAVGLFSPREGTWKLQDNLLTLELKGQVFADYLFWWVIEYKVTIEKNTMYLTVNKIHKNKKLPPTSTWEELIKE
jgi:hypothetical protein